MSFEGKRRGAILVKLDQDHPLFGKSLLEYEMSQKPEGHGIEKKRWIILLGFCIFSLSNAMLWITYSPVLRTVKEYYSVDTSDVIEFSNCFNYFYILSFFGAYLLSEYFSVTLFTAMVISATGGWLRYIGGETFYVAMIGQCCAAFAQNVVLFVPVLIADRWFPPSESLIAVSCGSLSNILGWGIGFLLPSVMLSESTDGMESLLYLEAIVASVPIVVALFAMRDQPKFPPSYCALSKFTAPRSMLYDVKHIIFNKQYLLSAMCFGNSNKTQVYFTVVIGLSYSVCTVLAYFLDFLTIAEQGYMGFLFVVVGVIGGMVGTYILSKQAGGFNLDRTLKTFMHIAMGGCIMFAIFVGLENVPFICFILGLLGIGLLGFQPFACQYVTETAYPVPEAVAVNMMIIIANVFGIVANFATTMVGSGGLWAFSVIMLPCWIYITFFFKGSYKKSVAEKAANEAARRTQYEKVGTPETRDSLVSPLLVNE